MELASKDSCTGCGNCRLVCKKNAVAFTRDGLNNIYPVIDSSKCVECGLCQKACPAINQVEKITPKQCYSCYATNKAIRKSSASGGVAQAVYRWCLKNDIPFAGVYFDNKELTAKYKLGLSEDDIHQFTNSKYTFSFMGNISEDIADILKNGKPFVFIGLPCQVAAVKKYIMILFFSPVSQALYPHISVKFSESFQKGCKTVKQAAMCIVGLFAIGGFLIILLRDFLISIAFGVAYTEYSNIIIPLVIWMILSITNNFLGIQFLVASGHQKEYSQAFSLSAVVTVLLNVALGFAFGVYGVSSAAAIGEAGLTLLLTHKILKVKSREEENI